MLGAVVKTLVENFSTEFDLSEAKDFFDDKEVLHSGSIHHSIARYFKLGASKSRLDQAFGNVALNIQWRKNNEKALAEWLHKWETSRFNGKESSTSD